MNNLADNKSNGKRILFACVPAEGHFNPLTGLAKHLQCIGYDVRWYAPAIYGKKLQELKIPFYPFDTAMDLSVDKMDTAFPGRAKIKSAVGKLNFDLEHFFIKRGPEYFADMQQIHKDFAFDLLIADVAFTGTIFVKKLMKIPVIAIFILFFIIFFLVSGFAIFLFAHMRLPPPSPSLAALNAARAPP